MYISTVPRVRIVSAAVRSGQALAVVRIGRHRPDPDENNLAVCRACGRPWPCDVANFHLAAGGSGEMSQAAGVR